MKFSANEESVVNAFKTVLTREGFDLRETSPHHIKAGRGSEAKLRLLGGLLTSNESLPVAVLVDTEATDAGTTAQVTVSDDFGFGSRAGLRGRYRDLAGDLLSKLQASAQDLSPPARALSVAPQPSPPAPTTGQTETRLKTLDRLRHEGLITDKEYEEKRKAILGEL